MLFKKVIILNVLIFSFLLCFRYSFAKVFLEQQMGKGGGEKALQSLTEWQSLYRSKATINGCTVDIDIFGVQQHFATVVLQIKNAFNDSSSSFANNDRSIWQATYEWQKKIIKYLVFEVSGSQGTIVFSMKYDKDAIIPKAGGVYSLFPAIANLLGKMPDYRIELEKRSVIFELFKVFPPVPNVQERLSVAMEREGWKNVNSVGSYQKNGLITFVKGDLSEICLIFADEARGLEEKNQIVVVLGNKKEKY